MIAASTRELELARWLLGRETHKSSESVDAGTGTAVSSETTGQSQLTQTTDVANRVLERLHGHLAHLFGLEGASALIMRALDRTRIDHPILINAMLSKPITQPGELPDAFFKVGPGDSAIAVAGALLALVGAIIALLARLLGDDMATHIIKQIWPGELPAILWTTSREASADKSPVDSIDTGGREQ